MRFDSVSDVPGRCVIPIVSVPSLNGGRNSEPNSGSNSSGICCRLSRRDGFVYVRRVIDQIDRKIFPNGDQIVDVR
jgi:hypothetical protein